MRATLLLLIIPAMCAAQLNITANVTIEKRPDMTVYRYTKGPVDIDTCWIGETGYLLPQFENPRFSEAAGKYWENQFFKKLGWNIPLNYSTFGGKNSGEFFGGSNGECRLRARKIVDKLAVDPWGEVIDDQGASVYRLPEIIRK